MVSFYQARHAASQATKKFKHDWAEWENLRLTRFVGHVDRQIGWQRPVVYKKRNFGAVNDLWIKMIQAPYRSGLKNQEGLIWLVVANALVATNTDSISGRGKIRTHAPDNNDESGSAKWNKWNSDEGKTWKMKRRILSLTECSECDLQELMICFPSLPNEPRVPSAISKSLPLKRVNSQH